MSRGSGRDLRLAPDPKKKTKSLAKSIRTKRRRRRTISFFLLLLLLWFSFMVFVTSSTDFKREKYQTHGGWTYVGVSWLTIFTSHSNWEIQLWWGEFVVRLYRMTPKSTVRWNVISGGTLLHPPPIHNTWKNNKQNPSWNFNCFVSDIFRVLRLRGCVCVCVSIFIYKKRGI